MHEIPRTVLFPLRVFGLDLSVTNEVVLLWLAGAATVAVALPGCRRRGPLQAVFEALLEFTTRQLAPAGGGAGARFLAPFLVTLFFFVLFSNLLSVVPVPAFFKAATANVNVTAALAVLVFVLSQILDFRHNGVRGYFRKFCPGDTPVWASVFLFPIELISRLARPFSLAFRLFANMFAGHAVLLLFLTLLAGARLLLAPFPLVAAAAMMFFEIAVCFLQAFVFTILAALYLREALEPGHGG